MSHEGTSAYKSAVPSNADQFVPQLWSLQRGDHARHRVEEAVVAGDGRLHLLVAEVAATGALPVVMFVAGGVATPADAALMMQIGVDGVFVGSGIFKSENPAKMARAIVMATTYFRDAAIVAEVSRGVGEPMRGLEVASMPAGERLASRGW